MNDAHPLMQMMFQDSSFVGPAESVENEILPQPDQLSFGPGDTGIMAMSNTELEQDFVVVRGADPAKYADQFPDWESRGFHVLCHVFSRSDPELRLGWYSRLKLMRISQYRYRETRKWIKDGWPDILPKWVEETYIKFTDAMSGAAPDTIPRIVTCPYCQGRDVILEVHRRVSYQSKVGVLVHDGVEHYVSVSNVEENSAHNAQLRCQDCLARADLSDDEWHLHRPD